MLNASAHQPSPNLPTVGVGSKPGSGASDLPSEPGDLPPEVSQFMAPAGTDPFAAKKARWKTWLRVVGSLLLLGLLAWKIDLEEAGRLMMRADPWLTVSLGVLFVAANVYNGFRWWVLLRLGGQSVPLWPSIRLTLWSGLLGTFVPGLVGVELIRFTIMTRHTKNPAMVFCSLMVDRLFGMVALFLLVLLGCLLSPLPLDPVTQWLAIGGIGAATCGSLLAVAERGQRWMRALVPSRLGPYVLPKLEKVFYGFKVYGQSRRALVGSLLLALFAQVIRILAMILADRALGIGLDPLLYLVIVPVTLFLEMVPLSLFGLGIREASIVAFFGLIGEPTENGLALSLFAFVVYTLSKLPGVIALMLEKNDVHTGAIVRAGLHRG